MKWCKNCLQPNTRPNIKFTKDGLCPPCYNSTSFDNNIISDKKESELKKIIEFGKNNNTSGYDCIIGVSGGKDSTRQAMYVKENLRLKPLLVCCSYPPEQITETGVHNISNLISLGFDTITISPAPETWKNLMRESFLKYGNLFKSPETALYASLPRMAIAYHIPLVFLGENPALQDGELGSGSLNWEANRMVNMNTIKDGIDDLLSNEIQENNIIPYRYPPENELDQANLKMVYLGYFWKNFTKPDNGNYSILQGLDIRDDIPIKYGSLFPHESVDEDFVIVNQMIKYMKFGFGKVVEDVSEAIRLGRMTRDEGVTLVNKYDGKCDKKYILRFCEYINLDEEEFWKVAETFRNHDLFIKNKNGEFELKYKP